MKCASDKRIFVLLIIALLTPSVRLHADFTRIISSREGLTNNSVLSLAQDPAGRIWLGTCEGLNVWDGRSVSPLGAGDSGRRLSGNLIERIHPSDGGVTWVETNYGLDSMFPDGSVSRHSRFRGMYRMLSWQGEDILVLTQADSLFRYAPGEDVFVPLQRPSGLDFASLLTSCPLPDGTLMIITKEGIFRLADGDAVMEKILVKKLEYAFSGEGEALIVDEEGILFRYGFEEGALEYKFDVRDELRRHGKISDIVREGNDILLAFLFDGVTRLRFHGETAGQFVPERLPLQCGVFDLMTDRNQPILWIATDGYGLRMEAKDSYDINSNSFKDLSLPMSTPVRAFLEDRYGRLWMGTKGEGLVLLDDGTSYFAQLSDPAVFALAESASGGFWIGSEGEGLDFFSYSDNKVHHVAAPEGVRYIHGLYESDDRTLWAATVGRGVFRLSLVPSRIPRISGAERLDFGPLRDDSDFFFSLYPDSDGSLWLGNRGGGLIHYIPSTGRSDVFTLEEGTGEVANDVWATLRSSSGELYAGTGYGLLRLDESTMKAEPTAVRGLVHQILEDGEGQIWMSTNLGIVRYSPGDGHTVRYGYSYGLDNLEFCHGAALRRSDGSLCFGGNDGFVTVAATGYERPAYTPPLSIAAVRFEGDWSPAPEGEILVRRGRRLTGVEMLAIDFLDGGNYDYFYRIDGLDGKWFESGADFQFPAVSPGKYVLNVFYRNPDTGYESPVLSKNIRILAPLYASTGARVLYFLMLAALISAGVFGYIRRRDEKHRRQIERMQTKWKEENLSSKLRILQNFASQIERPVSLQAVSCQQILDYGRSDDYVRSCADKALGYSERAVHTIRLFRSLSENDGEKGLPDIRLFSPREILSDLVETYRGLAPSRGVVFVEDIPRNLLCSTSPRVFASVADMLLTDAFFHAEGERKVSVSVSSLEDSLVLKIRMEGHWPDPRAAEVLFTRGEIMEYLEKGRRDGYELQDEMRLAVCYNMVSSVEGSASHSVEGADSVFTVTFPRMNPGEDAPGEDTGYRSVAPALMDAGGPVPATPGGDSKSLLLLGRDIEILQTVTGLFQTEFRIKTCSSPVQMNAALAEAHPDVIIVEMLSSSPDTVAAVRAVKEDKTTMQIPVIFITQASGESLPADASVTLPLDIRELKTVVGRNIRRMETLEDYFTSAVSIYELSDGKKLHREDKEFLEKLYRVIRGNMHSPDLTTSFVAAEMGTSVRSLYSRLENLVSITPGNIIREYRLSYSAQLLSKTRLTVDEIIYRSGFSNRGTFFKNFSKRYGCTPRAWRRDHQ